MKITPLLFLLLTIGLNSFAQPSVNLNTSKDYFCSKERVTIYSNVSGGAINYEWAWTDSNRVSQIAKSLDSLVLEISHDGANDTAYTKVYMGVLGGTGYAIDSIELGVKAAPVIEFKSNLQLCCNSDSFHLDSALKASASKGGTWSSWYGNLINNSKFRPFDACGDQLFFTYQLTNSINCSSQDSAQITVNYLPAVALETITICDTAVEIDMEDEIVNIPGNTNNGAQQWECIQCNGYSTEDFIYNASNIPGVTDYRLLIGSSGYQRSGTGISDTITLKYTFTNVFGCSSVDTATIYVSNTINPKFNAGRNVCFDEGLIDLNQLFGVSVDYGYWEVMNGTGVRDSADLGGISDSSIINTLNSTPLATETSTPYYFYLRYYANISGCTGYRDTFLAIGKNPEITMPQLNSAYCNTQSNIELLASPAGGAWTISSNSNALSGTILSPTLLDGGESYTLYYQFTRGFSACSSIDSLSIEIEGAKEIQLPGDTTLFYPHSTEEIELLIKAETNEYVSDLVWTGIANPGSISYSADGDSSEVLLDLTSTDTTYYFFIVNCSSGITSGVCLNAEDEMTITVNRFGASVEHVKAVPLQVSPNPASNEIQTNILNEPEVEVIIINSVGQQVLTLNQSATESINIKDLVPGQYYILVRGNSVYSGTFIKQ
ncbi:T9SS type A sorting domain-containing protein [bacterium]|nr:T9SS type A sorting domain-containing protein [bacterium]